jgi:hypothetical protein
MFYKIAGLLAHDHCQRNLGIMHVLGDWMQIDCIHALAWVLIARINKDMVAPMTFSDLVECMNISEISSGRHFVSSYSWWRKEIRKTTSLTWISKIEDFS